MDRILEDEAVGYLFFAVVTWLLVFWEFVRKWFAASLHLGGLIFFAASVSLYCVFRVWRLRRDVRNLKQADKAERHVSDLLWPLRGKDYVTFDDLMDETAGWKSNIDHVVVGPGGVFAIETKGYSIFGNGRVEIGKDGGLRLSTKAAQGDPLEQARSSARKISRHLKSCMRQDFFVQPILVFPGWKIAAPKSESGVVVLDDETIEEFFSTRQRVLTNAQITEICSHLDRSARS
jgi:Nuclease-related domain